MPPDPLPCPPRFPFPGSRRAAARQVVEGRAQGRRPQPGRGIARRAPDGGGLVAAPGFHQRLGEPPLSARRLVHVAGPELSEDPLPGIRGVRPREAGVFGFAAGKPAAALRPEHRLGPGRVAGALPGHTEQRGAGGRFRVRAGGIPGRPQLRRPVGPGREGGRRHPDHRRAVGGPRVRVDRGFRLRQGTLAVPLPQGMLGEDPARDVRDEDVVPERLQPGPPFADRRVAAGHVDEQRHRGQQRLRLPGDPDREPVRQLLRMRPSARRRSAPGSAGAAGPSRTGRGRAPPPPPIPPRGGRRWRPPSSSPRARRSVASW